MVGGGGVFKDTTIGNLVWDEVVPPQNQPNPLILQLSANLTWVAAHEPLHADIDPYKSTGIGPGMAFANAVLTKAPTFGEVGLVPCAVLGSTITNWTKGGLPYNQLVRRSRAALKNDGLIRAMLWFQGESDTTNTEDAFAYKWRLEKFFKDVRADLQYPLLPIILVAIESGVGQYVEIVRKAQPSINLTKVQCVDAKGLQLGPDRLHLTTPAQVLLGERLAHAFLH